MINFLFGTLNPEKQVSWLSWFNGLNGLNGLNALNELNGLNGLKGFNGLNVPNGLNSNDSMDSMWPMGSRNVCPREQLKFKVKELWADTLYFNACRVETAIQKFYTHRRKIGQDRHSQS